MSTEQVDALQRWRQRRQASTEPRPESPLDRLRRTYAEGASGGVALTPRPRASTAGAALASAAPSSPRATVAGRPLVSLKTTPLAQRPPPKTSPKSFAPSAPALSLSPRLAMVGTAAAEHGLLRAAAVARVAPAASVRPAFSRRARAATAGAARTAALSRRAAPRAAPPPPPVAPEVDAAMAAVFARRPAMRGTPVLVVTDGVLTCWDAPALWGGSRRELLARPGAVGALKELARHFRVVLVAQSAAHLARLACHLHSSAVQLDAAYGAGAGGALQAGGAALRAVLEGDASRRGAAVVDYDLILRDMCVRDAAAEVLFLSAVNLDFEELQGRRGADVLTDRSNAACPATCTGIPLPLPKFATKGVPSVLLVPQLRMQSFDAQALVSLLVGRRSASEGWPERLAASAPAVAPSFTAWSPADRASGRWTDGWATYAQHEVRFAALTSAVLGDRPRDAGVVTIRDDGSAGEKLRRTVLFGLRSLVKECNTSDPLTEEETSLWEQCFKYDVCGGLRRRTLQLQRPGTASRRQRIGESATLKFLDSEVKASPRGLAIVK